MNPLLQLECRTGPLAQDERMILRFGSMAAYERARARAAIRQITRVCMRAPGNTIMRLLERQNAWRHYLRALG